MKTGLQTVLFWSFFLLVMPWALIEVERALGIPRLSFSLPPAIPWTVFALAGTLGLLSGATMAVAGLGTPLPMDGARRLVTTGPYAHIRNPMTVAGLTQGACVGVWLHSPLTLAYVLAGGMIWNFFVRPIEERYLEAEFGAPFRRYREAVPCWWFRLRAYEPTDRPGT
ncbi:MAG: isoprenylcysteine carboxylmethyltransferase family protein [Acidobacteriota bacterium]|nr:isoprenylcysteine carboxylmethyltransferase family protein [Acidobacteriota bacterium]